MDEKRQTDLIIATREDVAAIKSNIENLCKSLSEHQNSTNKRLCDLEQKPVRRWDNVVTAFVCAIISAVIAFFTKNQ